MDDQVCVVVVCFAFVLFFWLLSLLVLTGHVLYLCGCLLSFPYHPNISCGKLDNLAGISILTLPHTLPLLQFVPVCSYLSFPPLLLNPFLRLKVIDQILLREEILFFHIHFQF